MGGNRVFRNQQVLGSDHVGEQGFRLVVKGKHGTQQ